MEVIQRSAFIAVTEESHAGEARRMAMFVAHDLGMDDTRRGEVAIVVTEIATNLVKHARGGELLLSGHVDSKGSSLEILGLDRGPGIADLTRSLTDGYSTSGTPGTGLGAVQRLADSFEVFSAPDQGTAVLACFGERRVFGRRSMTQHGGVNRPAPGEKLSGDAWFVGEHNQDTIVAVADGLGHGPVAAEASQEAMRVVAENLHLSPAEMMEEAHHVLQKTRGAAMAVAAIDLDKGIVRYSGIGNISGSIAVPGGGTRSMVSHNGTVGHVASRFHELSYPWPRDGVLVMHSDGIGTHWDLNKYRTLLRKDPTLVAAVLYRDHRRGRDDASVVVVRQRESKGEVAVA